MSGILDGLRKPDEQVPTGAGWYNAALDDVREALRNPTDEQVWAIVRKRGLFPPWAQSETEASLVRGVLAALAGDDQ